MKRQHPTVAYDHQIFAYQRFGGVSRYITELASRIPAVASIETCIVAPLHINATLAACGARKFAALKELKVPFAQEVRGAINRSMSRLVMAALRPDLVHWTYFNPIPLPRNSCSVVTIYDMVHELFPDQYGSHDSTRDNKRNAVARADHVICISHRTRADLMRLLKVPDEKISVTHLGYSSSFIPAASTERSEVVGNRPYLLYVGQRSGYKGFADAMRAFSDSDRLKREFDFIAFGGPPFHHAEMSLFASLGLRQESVRHVIGDDDDLARHYRGAHLFVYPSKYEGFGIPPLEAMACGCPVACANTSSLPEVVGDAAITFDPDNRDDMRRALEVGCFDGQHRARLAQAGRRRVAMFSWDRCAEQTAAIYARLIGRL